MNEDFAFVVESPITDAKGARLGIARVWVDSESRAMSIASQGEGRTWRKLDLSKMPPGIRDNILRARNEELLQQEAS